jgi:PAS domain S-box-containing protein
VSENSVSHVWTEEERLSALRKYAILDTSPEQAFDDIVRLAGQLLDAPIVAVNLIDADRQWFKAEIGLGVREMPLGDSICKFTLLEADRMVVPDTREDPRFDCNPLVTGAPGLRFYAGEVLRTADGLPLGTLCILDTKPRPQGLTALQAFALQTLARQVETQLELRKIVHDQEALLAEQRRTQAELRVAHDRFESIVSQAATGVVQTDAEGRITLANRKFCDMLGYDKSELLGLDSVAITAPASVGATTEALQQAMAGNFGAVVQKQYRKKDGSPLWATTSISAMRGPDGEYQGAVAIVVDITQSRLAEESLRQLATDLAEADQRKSEFLATLAHELRNPLAPISSGLSLLKLGGDNAASVAKIRPMMERQVGQMVRLIDDLLDVARISGGKIHLKKSPVELKTVIASAVETSLPFIERGGHKLVMAVPDGALMLDADPTRIAQVISNLLNNAAKYTPMGGRVDITARQDGGQVLITVKDNGVGIPAESLSSIFDMFSQVRHNLSRAQGGLGVGLSLVRRLVEMHGGTVSAASAGSGQGSSFTVSLPLAHSEAVPRPMIDAAETPADPGPGASPGRQLRLLVADDNVDAAEMLEAMLALQGHATRVAHNGRDALAIAREFAPDVAFLDIGMPDMNGYETAAAIRAAAGLEAIMLVALTGWGDERDRARAKEAGFDHHLTKPADLDAIDQLLHTVRV